MGSVYEAEKLSTHETFAVKLIREHLNAEASYLTRFEREISVLRAIRHPNVVDVFEWSFGDAEKDIRPFVVMELLEGESLDQLIKRERILAPAKAVAIMLQVLEGLAAAHAQGVLHRDLGPSNMFIQATASGKLSVKLLDFGLARALLGGDAGRAVTQEGTLMGKPAYVAPEQFVSTPLDERADLFACGIVLFRMLTGRLPYKSSDAQMLWVERWSERETTSELPSPRSFVPDIPEPVARAVLRAIRKHPDQRYRSAREMQTDLLAAEQSLPARVSGVTAPRLPVVRGVPSVPPAPSAPPSGASSRTVVAESHSSTVMGRSTASLAQPPSSRRSMALAAALVVFAAVAVVLAIRLTMRSGPQAPAAPAPSTVAMVEDKPDGDVLPEAEAPAEPDAGAAVKVASPTPDAGPAAPVEPSGPANGGPDAGLDAATAVAVAPTAVPPTSTPVMPRRQTVHFGFLGVPRGASVSVGGQSVDPDDGIDLPKSPQALQVVVNVPGGRYQRWVLSAVPDRDRTFQPELRPIGGGTGTSTPPARDAGPAVAIQPPPPVDAGGTARGHDARDAGSSVIDGRMGTSFITSWGDGR